MAPRLYGRLRRAAGADAEVLFEAVAKRRTWFWNDPERSRAGRMDLLGSSARIVAYALEDLGHDAPDLAARIAADYRVRRDADIAPYPGAIEALEAIRSRGVSMALITNGNGEAQRRSVKRFGLADYFNCIVIEGEFGVGKPDERVFRHALETTGCEPTRAWMVGDNLEADIAPAVRLGLHAVWVDARGGGLPADSAVPPHRIVRSIAGLPPLLAAG